ncbi:TauD/TfdA family dioxygenase [Rouxiella badensis]|uniref:TauD/TfdA family dioxygenase n=1 Tax=Rouxiella badensis TaxID=1646377 RepID=UPI001D138115|nr:TauD/TfdA family dioxygenase [Rouxiella badensis]MCC3721469.1 TauD/TfdA family dioxygenase [Rouxiella badensis]MCC3731081.1 TauD/TfdA family dioxygenase [Rouxiella badensis]MCC3736048.1 TauD/TfdA family dioxygenase [Rouxiella badensis]MCC3742922.1 TauD/TfdA family dioxygenase [Rouxiella badensis]MCC3761188.1 TauD/TfdA family dioxygenase [Rouxiella badensis]
MIDRYPIPEDLNVLHTIAYENVELHSIIDALQTDKVVLVRGTPSEKADFLISTVAEKLGLRSQLDIQSTFASVEGHRSNVGKHFMTVNKRADYQFIPPHSEGSPLMNMQLASLYCYENTTDGGESVLLQTNSESAAWEKLRVRCRKIDLFGKNLAPAEAAAAKMMHQINIPESVLSEDDIILEELPSPIPGTKLYDALAKIEPTYSPIIGRDVMVYWDDVASTDFDSVEGYYELLKITGLLKMPKNKLEIKDLDSEHLRRVWRSGVDYKTIFHRKITTKMISGDLIIMNNLTWTHSAVNWTPGSGIRNIVAAFA